VLCNDSFEIVSADLGEERAASVCDVLSIQTELERLGTIKRSSCFLWVSTSLRTSLPFSTSTSNATNANGPRRRIRS